MARPRKIPKRLPPRSKDFQKIIKELDRFLAEFIHFEKDSIALKNARRAIIPEAETKEPKQEPLPTTQTTTEKKTRKKKAIDLSRAPGEPPTPTEQAETKPETT